MTESRPPVPRLHRRAVLAAVSLLASPARAQRRAPAPSPRGGAVPASPHGGAVPASPRGDTPAPGWRRDVLIRWGDRVEFDAPGFDPRAFTDTAAATQFGCDAIVLGALPAPSGVGGVERLMLAVAHPTAEARMMFPGGHDRPKLAGLAQGASLLDLEHRGGRWRIADGGFQARRLTSHTLCRLAGPAAKRLGEAVPGVLAVGGGCVTPWGSVLLAEGDPAPWFERLGKADDRYADPAAQALYGWMVEFDPLDPLAPPVKRTAPGRFARAGAAATLAADGRAVVFMSDAGGDGFLFRFVSAAPAAPGSPGGNRTLLDEGTLSVACVEGARLRFADLPPESTALPESKALAEEARRAGAAEFDSPCGLAAGDDHTLHLACRGNPQRSRTDAFNPRLANAAGHVLAFHPDDGDPAAAGWSGEIVLLAGDPATGGGVYPEGSRAWLAAPQSLGRDEVGRLWIGTDRQGGG